MVTLRLDDETAKKIELLSRRLGVSRSELVRKSLLKLVEQPADGIEMESRLEAVIRNLPGSGDGGLSMSGRDVIGKKMKMRAGR